ncbi:hypothetical protein F4821DRAFT_229992 [Hypoxylon rubiginosum]|uniref:Uncharacterized protein n=1 Tax=Hypoxylon rubiginosum TaxID=110542 RepID=A0ACC0DBV0_9PEZI|nr:hypothetical protein F4821DRAFT_229992 [Hypoxylon rubiginosum]
MPTDSASASLTYEKLATSARKEHQDTDSDYPDDDDTVSDVDTIHGDSQWSLGRSAQSQITDFNDYVDNNIPHLTFDGLASAREVIVQILLEDEKLCSLFKFALGDDFAGKKALEAELNRLLSNYARQLLRIAQGSRYAANFIGQNSRRISESIHRKFDPASMTHGKGLETSREIREAIVEKYLQQLPDNLKETCHIPFPRLT